MGRKLSEQPDRLEQRDLTRCHGQVKPDTNLGTLWRSSLVFIRRDISQPIMSPLQIIKTVDIINNVCNTLTSGFIAMVVNSFSFQDAEKPLRNRIIQSVTLAAHAARHIKFPPAELELSANILRPLDRYMTIWHLGVQLRTGAQGGSFIAVWRAR